MNNFDYFDFEVGIMEEPKKMSFFSIYDVVPEIIEQNDIKNFIKLNKDNDEINLHGKKFIGPFDIDLFDKFTKINCSNSSICKILNKNPLIKLNKLNCSFNELYELDNLCCINIDRLYCGYNKIKKLDNIPSNIKYLDCAGNPILELDNLHDGLIYLNCENCNINKLENLPMTLENLICSNNTISSLDFLPESLISLNCKDCEINQLDNLPLSIKELICYSNKIDCLYNLPNKLLLLNCDNKTKILDINTNNDIINEFYKDIYKYIYNLNKFIILNNKENINNPKQIIDESHGLLHMLIVLYHVSIALSTFKFSNDISEKEKIKIQLAALLHDIDDHKYFPNNKNYNNARKILVETRKNENELSNDDIDDIIEMISWVSSSINGDFIPKKAIFKEYLLYPRYADRLEALGIIGVKRALQYTLKQQKEGNPKGILFDIYTPKARDEIRLWDIASDFRYREYTGTSKSMIDHFYDKLLRLGKFPIRNIYFDKETYKRLQPLIDITLYFGTTDNITEKELKEYIEDYIEQYNTEIDLFNKNTYEKSILEFICKLNNK